ncbi:hypothetical protein BGX31_007592, partial [Mortierella sp. GBA43]
MATKHDKHIHVPARDTERSSPDECPAHLHDLDSDGYKHGNQGSAINIRGKFSKKEKEQWESTSMPISPTSPTSPTGLKTPKTPAGLNFHVVIPQDAPSFKFTAVFEDYQAGHYVVSWRVKMLDDFSVPNGLRFLVSVAYDVESDTNTTMEIDVPPKELEGLERNHWYDLELEALVAVQPYEDSNGTEKRAHVDVVMSNCEDVECKYSGLEVEFVELSPFSGSHDCRSREGVLKHVVKRAAKSKFTINSMDSPVFKNDSNKEIPSTLPIKRLAWSKESTYLAALALWKDSAYISVWNMGYIGDPSNPIMDMTILHRHCTVAVIKHPHGENFANLSIGLAISPKGDQVALFQEPKIGQWSDGSKVQESEFPFCLLDNPPSNQHTAVDMTCNAQTSNVGSSLSGGGKASARDYRKGSADVAMNLAHHGYHTHELKRNTHGTHHILKKFVGYGEFLTETENNFWEMNDVKTALSSNVGAEDHQYEDEYIENIQLDQPSGQPKEPNTLFIACNGIYIDIFKVKQGHKWDHTRSINLTDLTPTMSRRTTCQILMDVITSNTFMWLEDNGLCCTIWDLQRGSNVSYISIADDVRLGNSVFKGNNKLAISPDESIVAMAGSDGILTTYYTSTGVVINDRKFPYHQIEYVAFHGHNSQIFLILRDIETLALSSCILDPLHLDYETPANEVPIPIIGKTILAFFRDARFKNKGLVCEAEGSKINFYISHEPAKSKVAKEDINFVDTSAMLYPPHMNVPKAADQDGAREEDQQESRNEAEMEPRDEAVYELRTDVHRELSQDGDGSMYWVHRVEVVKNPYHQDESTVFSFVPEPWMRVSASEIRQPHKLVKVFFLPNSRRFVVQGMQTIQIWSLPTIDDPEFNLLFIWSQPRTENDPKVTSREKKYKMEPVGKYYHRITELSIYLDPVTDNAVADMALRNGTSQHGVILPGSYSSKARTVYLHCIRSIHLLASAYTYSYWGARSTRKSHHADFTFEKHSQAIVRFTLKHINRILSDGDFYPRLIDQINDAPPPDPKGSVSKPIIFKILSTCKTESHGSSSKVDSTERSHTMDEPDEPRTGTPNTMTHLIQSQSKSSGGLFNLDRFKPSKIDRDRRPKVVTIFTLLLDQEDLADANRIFFEGLLSTTGNEWTPRVSMALNPVKRIIDFRNERLLKVVIDYCMRCAKNIHLGYLEPVEQCLSALLDRYPEVVADIFIRISYVPVHNEAYVTNHAIDSSSTPLKNIFLKSDPNIVDNEDTHNKVLTLRSQLHISTKGSREAKFPVRREKKKVRKNRSRRIYASPFQFQPVVRSIQNPNDIPLDEAQKYSVFSRIAGGDYFESPAMVVSLLYKWNKFGYRYWLARFSFVVVFFILVLVITTKQIHVSTRILGSDNPAADIQARYLPEWRPVFMVTAAMGLGLTMYEFLQFVYSPRAYLRAPYNYVDLAAYLSPVIGCFLFLREKPVEGLPGDGVTDLGPAPISVMGFGILFLYLNFLFELRVIRQLGIVVNIIFNITRKIGWFFMIFGLFIISFTHALMYVLYTRQPCQGDGCDGGDGPGFPKEFGSALLTTYFMLAGRYDPVDGLIDKGPADFQIMMVIFYFFTAILLLNILIALMNDAFNASAQEGEIAHLKLLSEVVAEVENTMTDSERRRGDNYPKYIYYCATEEEAARFRSKFSAFNEESLTFEGRYLLDKSNETASKMDTVNRTVDTIQDTMEKVRQENAELREM